MEKRRLSSIITCIGCLLILWLISACGDDLEDDDVLDHSDIYFTALETALAEALGKAPGEGITPDELATLTHLTVPRPRDGSSGEWLDIELLVHCINLKELDLLGYVIDLSLLAGTDSLGAVESFVR